jgi:hypothetical protein
MVEPGGGLSLKAEATQERLVIGQRGVEHLDRDPATQAHVLGQEHVCRPARAQGGEQPVAIAEDAPDKVADARAHRHDRTGVRLAFRAPPD